MIVILGAAAYANSLNCPFVFDDDEAIVKNVYIRELWPLTNCFKSPTQTTVDGRPVLSLSLAINYAISGLDVRTYHVTNLAIHLIAALALFGILRRLFETAGLKKAIGPATEVLALAAAILWVVHPLGTQAVTYIIQRAESLMAMFYLLTVYLAMRAFSASKRAGWYAGSVIACALAMGTKEVAISAPIIVWLIDRTCYSGAFGIALRRRPVFYAALATTMLIQVAIVAGSPRPDMAGFGVGKQQPLTYLATEFGVIVHYLRLSFWPVGLCIDYAWPLAGNAREIIPPLIIVAALLGATLWALIRKSAWGIAGCAFFLILAPTSSVLPMFDPIFEHRFYLPLAITCACVVAAYGVALRRWASPQVNVLASVVLCLVVISLVVSTHRRNNDYRTNLALWEDALAKRPENVRALINVGICHFLDGDLDNAVKTLSEAVTRDPNYAEGQQNLAAALTRLGRYDEAIPHYEACLKLSHNYHQAHYNLALVLEEVGRVDSALQQFEEALRLYPEYPEANEKYAGLLARLGRLDEAIEHYQLALRYAPDQATLRSKLGNLYVRTGRVREAIDQFRAALRLEPDSLSASNNLGVTLARTGATEEAIRVFTAALSKHADNASLHVNLANAYRSRGNVIEARRQFEEALRLSPNSAAAIEGLRRLSQEKDGTSPP